MIKDKDPKIFACISNELSRQRNGLEMIPSENFVSLEVLEALGSVFTNKYSEGYPRKRYYGGNEFVDDMEELAIERAKQLFGAEHVNVQPLSGSPANMAVYSALMKPGNKLMGLKLDHGGHLTHGHPVNFSGKYYNIIQYEVDKDTELLDYGAIRVLALKHKPRILLAGFTAYPRQIDFRKFREIADACGAYLMVDMSHFAGLVAGGVYPNPVPVADVVTTTTHKTLRGPRGAIIMCRQDLAKKIDKAVFPGLQGGPHDNNNCAKAVAFNEALQPEFKTYAGQIVKNAVALAKTLKSGGLRLVSGGTDTHLLLVDLSGLGITGKDAELALDKAGIYVNKNTIPFDKESPFVTSGIRLGTPALTTRGMKEPEMKIIGDLIVRMVNNTDDERIISEVKSKVMELCSKFPLYKELSEKY
ncbi:serine hydroxymethyltransferase [Candidatus Woesearchaeota archaeon]|nr:serine hydroxymethyltransferase [Candidatus Woesearchaeota archaeon]